MALAQTLSDFQTSIVQCDALIANVHQIGPTGVPLLPSIDQRQITIAAFLNMFIAWETFLELCLIDFMAGAPTIRGTLPVRYVSPPTMEAARAIVIGAQRYFDYGNHENVRKVVSIYFQGGYPFEPHLSSALADLGDIRTMRNASAHITSTTQTALEALSHRLLRHTSPGIQLYDLLLAPNPGVPGQTVFSTYRDILLATAQQIANG